MHIFRQRRRDVADRPARSGVLASQRRPSWLRQEFFAGVGGFESNRILPSDESNSKCSSWARIFSQSAGSFVTFQSSSVGCHSPSDRSSTIESYTFVRIHPSF